MAQQAPTSVDVQEIQFKLHDRWNVFSADGPLRSNVNLLAAASSQGMLFAGNPNSAEFKVILLKNLVESKTTGVPLTARQVELPNVPNVLAASADGSMLAVNITMNGSALLQIYSVPSFITGNIKLLYTLSLSPEEGVSALQLLWNPVLTNNLAVVLSNGAVGVYNLKDGGTFEFHSLDKQHQVRCGCWSPKGKQIVLGFPNGKLQQFKPDLTPAKMIVCPVGVHPGPFETIAVHWLSTFQFVAAFMQQGEEQSPMLYIVNAPKGASPSYINYFDICYSASGPRQHQINFTHIHVWNLLLVTSANGVELGILGTKENGESPIWVQYTLLDESRIEMPLTEDKEETYPIGFAFDTASTHQLVVGEKKLPVMPMVHVLSTNGHLVSFNFLNLTPNAADVCSPPPPITDASGMFKALDDLVGEPSVETPPTPNPPPNTEMSFAFNPNMASSISTPVKDTNTMFGQASANTLNIQKSTTVATQPPTIGSLNSEDASSPFGSTTSAPTSSNVFSGFGNGNTFAGLGGLAKASEQVDQVTPSQMAAQSTTDLSKPLYTVPATFTPPVATANADHQKPQAAQQSQQQQKASVNPQVSTNEIDAIVKQMIAVQINSFDLELQQISQKSNSLLTTIGKPDEMKSYTKRLHDLQEIVDQAGDRDFEMDVQNLRHSLNESYAMLEECRTKLDMYNNPDITRLTSILTFDPTNRRQLAKLKSNVTTNQAHLQQLQQQIDAQWVNYQDLVRRNSKSQMHIPCLDGIYQRMTKLKDLVACQRTNINCIKTKLRQKGFIFTSLNELDVRTVERQEATMESLADSILSMSLANVVDATRSKLSLEKLSAIRSFLQDRLVVHIKPHRPDRVGLKSEVILETKLQSERQSREGAVTRLNKMQQEKIPTSSVSAMISKPTATKPTTSMMGQSATSFVPPSASTPSFSFGGASSFVKTATSTMKTDETLSKPPVPSTSTNAAFPAPSFMGFGAATSDQPSTFGQTLPVTVFKSDTTPDVAQNQKQAPISFAAKVVSSEASKKPSNNALKPAVASSQDKESKHLGETEIPKTFSFGSGAHDSVTIFGGGGGDAKSSLGAGNVSLFSGLSSPKSSPFDLKSGSGFNFGGTGTNLVATSATANAANKPFSFGSLSDSTKSNSASTVTPDFSTTKSSNSNVTSTAATSTTNVPLFSGLGKSVGGETTTAAATTITPTFSFGSAINLSTTKSTSSTVTTATTTTDAPGSISNTTTTSSNEADSLFSSFNICKPTTKETNSVSAGNVFGSNAFSFTGGDSSKSLFGNATTASSFSFGEKNSQDKTATTAVTSTSPVTAAAATSTLTSSDTKTTLTVTSSTAVTTQPPASTTFSFSMTGLGTTTTPTATSATSTFTTVSAVEKTAASTAVSSSSTVATSSSAAPTSTNSIFGGTTSSVFNTSSSNAATSATSTPSVFGTTTAPTSVTASSPFAPAAAAASTAATGNIFGGIPKPDQSVFGSPPAAPAPSGGGLFATAAAANPLPFGSSATASGGSIFGGSTSSGFGANTATTTGGGDGGNIFGGGNASSPFGSTAAGASIFGGAVKPVEGANIFGSPTQPAGSIFGQTSTFGQSAAAAQSGSSLFGAGSIAQQPSSGFGSSIFGGGTANTASSGGSIFGGSQTAPAFGQSSTGGFGSFSQSPAASAFGSPNAGNSFAQGGASVAQSGFGSPQQQTSPFAKPSFGGAATFGSPPAFGAQPSFGGAPTFGSPKGFGSFATTVPAATPAFASPTQKNSLFETLGSTETGLSFGNLAQNTNANAAKPSFGGSSFMNYRA